MLDFRSPQTQFEVDFIVCSILNYVCIKRETIRIHIIFDKDGHLNYFRSKD